MAEKTKGRLYIVKEDGNQNQRLVRAGSQAQAIGYVVRNTFTATVATVDEAVELSRTCRIEDASDQPSGQAGE